MDIALQIKQKMAELDMTQDSLAERMQVRQSHLSRALSEGRDPKISTLVAIAHALNCEVRLVPRDKPGV